MRKVVLVTALVAILCGLALGRKLWVSGTAYEEELEDNETAAQGLGLPSLDAQGYVGVQEFTRAEFVALMSKERPLSRNEQANLDRGCTGLASLYQRRGVKRWPESAPGTRAYLRLEDALRRKCPGNQENFVFLKQAWWVDGKPQKPDLETGEVPLSSITHQKVGWYTFNYAVYFPTSGTYAWINHRDYGFPINLFKPQKAYLSLSPPPLDDGRTGEVYCSTCRD